MARPTKLPANTIDIRKAIKQRLAGMSYADIATSQGVSRQAAQSALKPIMVMIGDPELLKAYQDNKADIMDGLQRQLARKMLDKGKLKSASINNLAYALRQLSDIGRLERGESTANVAVGHVEAIKTMKEVDDEIASITEELPQEQESPERYKDDPNLRAMDEEIARIVEQDVDIIDNPDDM